MNRLHKKLIRLAAVVFFGVSLISCSSDYEYADLYRNLPFEMVKVHKPQIPPRTVNIEDFGGTGDGVVLNTAFFAEAIEVLAQNGGGRLVVPKGVWLTGPFSLRDNVELHVMQDAVLLFAADTSKTMLNASGLRNIAITGGGIIDGNGDKRKSSEASLISIEGCETVLLADCILQNHSGVLIDSKESGRLIFSDIEVKSPYAKGGEGLSLDSCEDVLLLNSGFDVESDAVRIKAVRNLAVDNCNLLHSNGGVVVDGSMAGMIQNVSISDSRIMSSVYGMRFICTRGTGAVVDGLYVKDVIMTDIASDPLFFDLYNKPKASLDIDYVQADGTTPTFKNIHISNVVCSDAARASYFGGIPEKNIENLVIENCSFVSDKGMDIRYSSGVVLKNLALTQFDSLAYRLSNCRNVVMHGCSDSDRGVMPTVFQLNSENVVID